MSNLPVEYDGWRTPDAVSDLWMPALSGAEFKVLHYIARRTLGFRKTEDRISLTQFESGVTRNDGTKLDGGTGLNRDTVCLAIDALIAFGAIIRTEPKADAPGNTPPAYAINVAAIPPDEKAIKRLRAAVDLARKSKPKKPKVVGKSDYNQSENPTTLKGKNGGEVVGKSDHKWSENPTEVVGFSDPHTTEHPAVQPAAATTGEEPPLAAAGSTDLNPGSAVPVPTVGSVTADARSASGNAATPGPSLLDLSPAEAADLALRRPEEIVRRFRRDFGAYASPNGALYSELLQQKTRKADPTIRYEVVVQAGCIVKEWLPDLRDGIAVTAQSGNPLSQPIPAAPTTAPVNPAMARFIAARMAEEAATASLSARKEP